MPSRHRRVDEGARRARAARQRMGDEIREARIAAGLTQRQVGTLVGVSHTHVGRVERALVGGVSIDLIARMLSVVGLELSIRAYPSGSPVRDAGHLAPLARFRTSLPRRPITMASPG